LPFKGKALNFKYQDTMDINCQFSNCVYYDGTAIKNCDDAVKPISNWSFSKMDCSIPDFSTSSIPSYISKITSTSSPEKTFYLSNTIDTGQLLMLSFGIIFFVFGVVFLIFSIKNTISKKV